MGIHRAVIGENQGILIQLLLDLKVVSYCWVPQNHLQEEKNFKISIREYPCNKESMFQLLPPIA